MLYVVLLTIGIGQCQDGLEQQYEYTQIQNAADCCRSNGANVGGVGNGGAQSPADCEIGCTVNERCQFFSHSMKWKNCAYCSICDLKTSGSSSKYTSWKKSVKVVQVNYEYEQIHDAADCCRSNNANVGGFEGGAQTPADCENGCTANERCHFFSHSMKWKNCGFCSTCDFTTRGNGTYYTSWRKVNTLAPPFHYVQIHNAADCCRSNSAEVGGVGNGGAQTPADCENGCTEDEQCQFFSHSTKWKNCGYCSLCDFTTTGNGSKYTSWKKVEYPTECKDDPACSFILDNGNTANCSKVMASGQQVKELCPKTCDNC